MPLIFAMSTALPDECWETLPDEVRSPWPQRSDVTVGRMPEAARNSSVASTRRSTWPVRMSSRPQE